MTTNNNQPEDKAPTFTAEQDVWVKARICNDELDRYGDLKLNITYSHGSCLAHCLPSEIRTTEQIILENTTMDSPTMYRFFDPVYGAENAKNTPQNVDSTPHNAELPAQNAELTEQNAELTAQNAELTEPDRTRMFRKGDKVQRRKELYGRPLNRWEDEIPFDVIYEALEDEDPLNNHNVKIEHNGETYFVNFVYFDLVEPAPEPKYWLHESPKTYSIYYKGQFGRVITAMLMQKDLYTLEEAQAECDRLNKK